MDGTIQAPQSAYHVNFNVNTIPLNCFVFSGAPLKRRKIKFLNSGWECSLAGNESYKPSLKGKKAAQALGLQDLIRSHRDSVTDYTAIFCADHWRRVHLSGLLRHRSLWISNFAIEIRMEKGLGYRNCQNPVWREIKELEEALLRGVQLPRSPRFHVLKWLEHTRTGSSLADCFYCPGGRDWAPVCI